MSEAVIKNNHIVIEIPIDILNSPHIIPPEFLDMENNYKPNIQITDVNKFAEYFVKELNKENEIGDTLINTLLDRAYINAVNDGAEGVEYLKND